MSASSSGKSTFVITGEIQAPADGSCSYSQHNITDAEFNVLPPRLQESVRRRAQAQIAQNQWNAGGYHYQPAAPPSSFKRYGTFCIPNLAFHISPVALTQIGLERNSCSTVSRKKGEILISNSVWASQRPTYLLWISPSECAYLVTISRTFVLFIFVFLSSRTYVCYHGA